MEKIAQWRDVNEVQDREAKLSRPAKTAEGPIGLTSGEINDLEKAIERLERKHTQKSQKDPFDPNVFNTKYSTKKP